MKYGITALTLALASAFACADDTPAPAPGPEPVAAGQTWTYKRIVKTPAGTTESRTIFRVAQQGAGLIVESMPAALTGRPTIWHKGPAIDNDSCMVDFFGAGSLGITSSCTTTFSPGMDWTTEHVIKGTRLMQRYEVVDTDLTTVAAGSFHAAKIVGEWQNAASRKLTHRVTYWYAPETRAMIKVHREFLNSKGAVESESTEELERFRANIAR